MTLWVSTGVAALGMALAVGSAEAGESGVAGLGTCGLAAGVYRLPGTDGCLRLSGFVATDFGTRAVPAGVPAVRDIVSLSGPGAGGVRAPDIGRSAIGADARLSADVRLPTVYGPARLFVSIRARHGLSALAR